MNLDEILTELERRGSAARYIPHLVRLVRAGLKLRASPGGSWDDLFAIQEEWHDAVRALEEIYGK